MYLIRLLNIEESFPCALGKNVLQGMQSLAKKGIPIGCRGGGCGICRIRVTQGQYRCQKMSQAHVNDEEIEQGLALACRLYPESDLEIEVLGLKNGKKPLKIT
jgi:ferredoxin